MGRIEWPVVVRRAAAIVAEYGDHGCTLRQCHYRLVSEGAIPNTAPTYRRLSAQLARARREGRFPALVDTLREVHVPPSWPDLGAFMREMPRWFGLDRTVGQPVGLYLAAEKDTLRSLITRWVEDLGVPVLVVRGFGSQSYIDVVRERTARDSRPARLLYVGDFDASGEDVERDFVERTACWSAVHRVALTYEQVQAYGLPSAEGKQRDPRWPGFAHRYGFPPNQPVQWEVEALDPAELRRLVLAAIAPFIDRVALAHQAEEEGRQRRQLEVLVTRWEASRSRARHGDEDAGPSPS